MVDDDSIGQAAGLEVDDVVSNTRQGSSHFLFVFVVLSFHHMRLAIAIAVLALCCAVALVCASGNTTAEGAAIVPLASSLTEHLMLCSDGFKDRGQSGDYQYHNKPHRPPLAAYPRLCGAADTKDKDKASAWIALAQANHRWTDCEAGCLYDLRPEMVVNDK